MAIHRLNHAVLYIRDLERSRRFYCEVLRFAEVMSMPGRAAFLRAPGSTNDHDLGLFSVGSDVGNSPAGRSTVGLYHLAWEVDTLGDLRALEHALAEAGALVGTTDHGPTKSLYACDPDGLERGGVAGAGSSADRRDRCLDRHPTTRPEPRDRAVRRNDPRRPRYQHPTWRGATTGAGRTVMTRDRPTGLVSVRGFGGSVEAGR